MRKVADCVEEVCIIERNEIKVKKNKILSRKSLDQTEAVFISDG